MPLHRGPHTAWTCRNCPFARALAAADTAQGVPYVSIHPCRHAEVMQRLVARCLNAPTLHHRQSSRVGLHFPTPHHHSYFTRPNPCTGWRSPATPSPPTSQCFCSSSSSPGLLLTLCTNVLLLTPARPHLQRHSHHRVRFHSLHVIPHVCVLAARQVQAHQHSSSALPPSLHVHAHAAG